MSPRVASNFRSAQPGSIRSDSKDIETIAGYHLNRIGMIMSLYYARAQNSVQKRNLNESVASAIMFLESLVANELMLKDHFNNKEIVDFHALAEKNVLNFTSFELMKWLRLVIANSRTLAKTRRVSLQFEDGEHWDKYEEIIKLGEKNVLS